MASFHTLIDSSSALCMANGFRDTSGHTDFFLIWDHFRFSGHCHCYTTAMLWKPVPKKLFSKHFQISFIYLSYIQLIWTNLQSRKVFSYTLHISIFKICKLLRNSWSLAPLFKIINNPFNILIAYFRIISFNSRTFNISLQLNKPKNLLTNYWKFVRTNCV